MTIPTIPANPPAQLTKGMTIAFTVDAGTYPASDGWALKWGIAGRNQLVGTGTDAGGGRWTVTVSRQQNMLSKGAYRWALWVERTSPADERVELARGATTVVDNVGDASAGSQQLTDEETLELVSDAINARARRDTTRYTIGDRALDREPLEVLLKWQARLRSRIGRQRRGGRMKQITVGFTRA